VRVPNDELISYGEGSLVAHYHQLLMS
jgi:hypothetical protein